MATGPKEEVTYFPLYPRVRIHLLGEPDLELPLELEEEIEYLWQREKAKRNLYNQLILCLDSHNETHLFCRFVEYRYFIASRESRKIHEQLNLYPLGVSGVTLCNHHVLVGCRDSKLASFGGYMELVPSGSIEARAYQHGEVDFIAQILWELQEEARISQSSVKEVHPLGLFFSSQDGVYDIGLVLNVDRRGFDEPVEGSQEYPLLDWYPFEQWEAELATSDAKIVPLSRALWKSVGKKS